MLELIQQCFYNGYRHMTIATTNHEKELLFYIAIWVCVRVCVYGYTKADSTIPTKVTNIQIFDFLIHITSITMRMNIN